MRRVNPTRVRNWATLCLILMSFGCGKVKTVDTSIEDQMDLANGRTTLGTTSTNQSVSTGPTVPIETSCRDIKAITIYPWTNAEMDPIVTPPTLGPQKYGTFEIANETDGEQRPPREYLNNIGWNVTAAIHLDYVNQTSQTTIYINKFSQIDMENELTCSFGPESECSGTGDMSAKMQYANVGVGLEGVDAFIGFLSCPAKYIACKVTKLTKLVKFSGPNGAPFTLNASQPFVIKRGCGQ